MQFKYGIAGLILLISNSMQKITFKYLNRTSSSFGVKKCLDTVTYQHAFWSSVLIKGQGESDGIEQALKIPMYYLDLKSDKPAWFPNPAKMENRLLYVIYNMDLKSAFATLLQTGSWNPRDKMIIFEHNLINKHNISEIFQYLYHITQFRAMNIALVSLGETLEIQAVYLNNPFFQQLSRKSDCSDLFPNYFNDINGYSLSVSMKLSLMFKKTGSVYHGPEAQIAESVISAMNGTVRCFEETEKDYGYERLPLSGILDDVSQGRTTASFNGRPLTCKLQELRNKHLIELTYPNYQDNIVAVIPFDFAQSKFLKAYYSLVLIYVTFSCFLAVSLYFKLFIRNISNEEICWMMLSLPMNRLVAQWTSRPMHINIALGSLMVVCFIINASWFSMLTKAVTVPVQPKLIKTVRELAFEEQCTLKISRRLQNTLDDVLDRSTFLALNRSRFDIVDSDEERSITAQLSTCNPGGAIMEHLLANNLRKAMIRRKMRCFITLGEILVPAWATFPVTFGSPFLTQIDLILSRMFQAGLNKVIFNKFDYMLNPSKRGKWYYKSSYHNTPLSFFSTTFRMLLVGYILAMIIFIMELMYFRFQTVVNE